MKGAPQRISHAHPHAAAAGKSAGELFVATGKKNRGQRVVDRNGFGLYQKRCNSPHHAANVQMPNVDLYIYRHVFEITHPHISIKETAKGICTHGLCCFWYLFFCAMMDALFEQESWSICIQSFFFANAFAKLIVCSWGKSSQTSYPWCCTYHALLLLWQDAMIYSWKQGFPTNGTICNKWH